VVKGGVVVVVVVGREHAFEEEVVEVVAVNTIHGRKAGVSMTGGGGEGVGGRYGF